MASARARGKFLIKKLLPRSRSRRLLMERQNDERCVRITRARSHVYILLSAFFALCPLFATKIVFRRGEARGI